MEGKSPAEIEEAMKKQSVLGSLVTEPEHKQEENSAQNQSSYSFVNIVFNYF